VHRFIYISTAARETGEPQLKAINSESSFCNTRDKLTGVLLWADNAFFQLIEGPKLYLDAAIGRIYLDRRHTGILRMTYRPTVEPICKEWAMGIYPMSASEELSEMFDAKEIKTVFERLSSVPDMELDVFLHTFYDTNVGKKPSQKPAN